MLRALQVAGQVVRDTSAGGTPPAVVVATPGQFQEAVRAGVEHIVISDHLDMTQTPRFSETTVMDSGMIAVVPSIAESSIRSIRVRLMQAHACACDGPVSIALPRAPSVSPPALLLHRGVRSSGLI